MFWRIRFWHSSGESLRQEHREIDRFAGRNQQVFEANTRVNRLWAAFGPIITLMTDIGLLVIWAFGAYRVAHDQITVGVLTAFVAYIGRLYVRLDSMSRMLANAQRSAAATHRIFEILDRVPSVAEATKPIQPDACAAKSQSTTFASDTVLAKSLPM